MEEDKEGKCLYCGEQEGTVSNGCGLICEDCATIISVCTNRNKRR